MGKGQGVIAGIKMEKNHVLASSSPFAAKASQSDKRNSVNKIEKTISKKAKKEKTGNKEKKEKKAKNRSPDSKKTSLEKISNDPNDYTPSLTPKYSSNKENQDNVHQDEKEAKFDLFRPANPLSGQEDDFEDTNIELGDVVTTKAKLNDISSFGMTSTTVNLLKEKGFISLFDIQAATFRLLRFEHKDVIGRARTGTGKTLAFVLPIIESIVAEQLHLTTRSNSKPLVLCLAPTRELANQVQADFEWVSSAHGLSSACFTGGTMKGPQKGTLRCGLDVLVGTPGRVIDLMDEGYLSLSGVRYIVLDEADEMLSMGFQEAVEKILGACNSKETKQTLLFSATIPRWVKDLARKYMRMDDTVTVDTVSDSKNRTNNNIKHLAIACPPSERGGTIADVLKVHTGASGKTIIFTDTKAEANEVASIEKVVSALGGAGVLHGDIPQGQRERTLAAYRNGNIRVLVATDVAARGLDINAVDLVLQTHPPSSYETYIHRSGRTGRAGKSGTCVTFYSLREKFMVGLIERKAGIKMHRANPPQALDIVRASVTDTVKKISSVHADNLSLFREVARKVLENYKGREDAAQTALAASLACMAGYTEEKFKRRSMLSCHQGFVAAVMSAPHTMESSRHGWSLVRQYLGPQVAAECRGLQICKDKHVAVFDAPEDAESMILAAGRSKVGGLKFDIPRDSLPELDDGDFDMNAAVNAMNEKRNAWKDKRGQRESHSGLYNGFDKGFGGGGGWRGNGGRDGNDGFRQGSGERGGHRGFRQGSGERGGHRGFQSRGRSRFGS